MSLNLFKEKNIIIAVLMTIAIFMVDLYSPLWYDVWVLYLIPLFFMFQSAKRPYLYSVIVTMLIAAGLFLSHSDSTLFVHSAANRITGAFGGWGVSVLLMRLKHLHVSLIQSHNEIEKRIEERTDELSRMNRLLQEEIVERKLAEKMTSHLAAIVQSAEDAIVSKDLNGIVQTWNVGAEKIFGCTAEEIIGRNISVLVPSGHTDEVPDILKRISIGERIENFETVRMRKDGTIIPVLLTFSPIKDGSGRIVGASKIAHDITERKQLETERDHLIVELQEALAKVTQLSGLLPICVSCKKIRDDKGDWNQIETFISEHSAALFTHAICPECGKKLYPEHYDRVWGKEDR